MPSPSQSRRLRIHRRISEQDRWLDEMGLFRKHIITDSNCLFRAVSENIYKNQSSFNKVRRECVDYMAANESIFVSMVQGSFKQYVKEMSNSATYGGLTEISVMCHLYRRDFIIYDNNKGPKTSVSYGYGNEIYLYLVKEKKHYDALFAKEHMDTVSFCQSLAYGILYKGVYEMTDVDYAVRKMLYNESVSHVDYFMVENVEKRKKIQELEDVNKSDELSCYMKDGNSVDECGDTITKHQQEEIKKNNLTFTLYPINSQNGIVISLDTNNAKDLMDNKILPFPYKVAKALDPNVYRNIELDTWYEIKRDEQTSGHYCDGLSLQVGVKCLCRLSPGNPTSYHCHIQEMKPDEGPCVVFVEELGEMRTVALDQLRPLPVEEAKPWYTPYRKDRTKFSTIAHILRQLGYIGPTNNLHRFRCKVKKAGSVGHDLARIKDNQGSFGGSRNYPRNSLFCKEDILDFKMEDNNNNIIWNDESCDASTPNSVHGDDKYCHQYLEKYTKLDMDNFEPCKIEMVAMPLIVEQNSNGSAENGNREGSGRPMSGTYLTQQESVTSSIHYTLQASNGNEGSVSPVFNSHPHNPMTATSIVTHPGQGSVVWGVSAPPPYGVYCAPPPVPPHGMPLHRLPAPPPPPGVNLAVQRSINANGSDLPYHDVLTLRFFFNLGVEWMNSSGGWPHGLPPLLGPPLPPAPAPHAAYHSLHHNRVSPNQLAIDMQQNLSLEESPNANMPQEHNKYNNNKSNAQRTSGKNSEYTPKGARGGGFNPRYRRNDGAENGPRNNNNKSGHGFNRNQNNFNNNRGNFSKPKNSSNENSPPSDNQEQKEQPSQENSGPIVENSFGGNLPYVSFPPPPIYRIPCYPVDGDGSMMSVGYPPQYLSYGPVSDDSESPYLAGGPPAPQYVTYLPTAPPLFYPPTSNYPGYAPAGHFAPPVQENPPK